jgi:hypothetical protein
MKFSSQPANNLPYSSAENRRDIRSFLHPEVGRFLLLCVSLRALRLCVKIRVFGFRPSDLPARFQRKPSRGQSYSGKGRPLVSGASQMSASPKR